MARASKTDLSQAHQQTLKNQERYGSYDTSSLSLLLVALKSPGGLEEIFLDPGKS